MTDERTPLIERVDVRPHRDRYPHYRLRFVCTTILTTVVLVGGLVAVFLFSFAPFDNGSKYKSGLATFGPLSTLRISKWMHKTGLEYDELQTLLLGTIDAERAREWSRFYTSGPHLAGKNLSQALWTKERWEEFGVASTIVDYDVYLNYPKSHRLALLERTEDQKQTSSGLSRQPDEWKVKYEARLEEDVLDEDKSSQLTDRVPTFHGYSASGNVTAPYIFVNYGTYQDFEDLLAANITLEGRIALARYGGIFRGLLVKRAQELGMVGVVIYSDPGDDGEITEKNGYAPYPDGPAREPSSVQRGSVQFLSFIVGDPTTPGYPSKPGAPRQPVDSTIPRIPSIPISYLDALPLLQDLNGHGPKASSFYQSWQGGGLGYKDVKYSVGPSPDNCVLNLVNEQDYVTTPIWNVIGIINGTIPDEVIILGNHRDAWTAGGAADPNAGSAAFNEVIRSFGIALQAGWKPTRTIVFASWDAEEYGLLGSTEWVEDYLPWLSGSAVAYLNVDIGVSGPNFRLISTPLLNELVKETLQLVPSPNQTIPGQSIYDVWSKQILVMGSGSDFTAFQDFAGVPSLDIDFRYGPETAIYHYHSNYDSYDWMERFGDPTFEYHAALAKVWALITAKLVDRAVLPLDATGYSIELEKYITRVKQKAQTSEYFLQSLSEAERRDIWTPLDEAISHFAFAAVVHDGTAAQLLEDFSHIGDIPWWKPWEKLQLLFAIRLINTKYKFLERKFLHSQGLDGRPWFKHIVFAPGKWTGYAGETFPGIVEGIEEKNSDSIRKWIGIATEAINGAADWLEE